MLMPLEETVSASRPEFPHAKYAEALDDRFTRDDDPVGCLQVVCATAGTWVDRAAPILARLLAYAFEDTGKRVFRRLRIIAPSGSDTGEIRRQLVAGISDHVVREGGERPDASWDQKMAGLVDVDATTGLASEQVLALLDATPEFTAVAILSAAEYTSPDTPSPFAPGEARIMGEDEMWARRLHALATAAADVAERRELFVMLDTGREPPSADWTQLLQLVPGCSLLGLWRQSAERQVQERLPEWRRMMEEGGLGAVLRELGDMPGLDEYGRATIRIQLLAAAGQPDQAMAEISALDPNVSPPADLAAKLALIAARAGGSDTAVRMLRDFRDDILGREDVQNALQAAERAGDEELADVFAGRLEVLHPTSDLLATRRYKAALRRFDHEAAAQELGDAPERAALADTHRMLAKACAVQGAPDYAAVIAQADARGNGRLARTEVARHALEAGRTLDAVAVLLSPEAVSLGAGTSLLAECVERILLGRRGDVATAADADDGEAGAEDGGAGAEDGDGIDEADDLDLVGRAVEVLVERLAHEPQSKALRVRLLDLMEPATSGNLGVALAAFLLARAGMRPTQIVPRHEPASATPTAQLLRDEALKARLGQWFAQEHVPRVGHSRIPADLVPGDPDEVAEGIVLQLGLEAPRVPPDDVDGVMSVLVLGTALAKHAQNRDVDMEMIRVAAAGLAMNAGAQKARDVVETMVEIADTAARRRLAWFGLADVYARCNRNIDAAIYAAAGMMASPEVDHAQLWHETLVVSRIQRDLGRDEDALRTIDAAETVLASMGRTEEYRHRLGTMRLQVKLQSGGLRGIESAREFEQLLQETVANAREVLAADDEPGIVALMLAQLLRHGRNLKVAIPDGAEQVLADLKARTAGAVIPQMEALGRELPTGDDLLVLLRASSGQRYSEDVATDARSAALAARRALGADATLTDPALTALALELTTDRAIAQAGWTDAKRPPDPPTGGEDLLDTARAISSTGPAVLMAGTAEDGSLVRLAVTAGKVGRPQREEAATFSRQALESWRRDSLYDYGIKGLDEGVFDRTTKELGWTALPDGPTIVISDTALRSYPPTLLRAVKGAASVRDDPAGLSRPLAAAPSLTWLAAARRLPSLGDGRRVAWMPGEPGKGSTMAFVAGLCQDGFQAHGVQLDQREELPAGLAGASLVIVVAHGSLNPHGGAFQVVTDEGRLAATAADLARSLHGVGVVLLFVCSGGRSDRHPLADATLGLPRELLDQGVQAVVGSPWPLESQVPARWLPTFLDRWDSGDTLMDAVHSANMKVQDFHQDWAQSLAMNVLGNPEVRDRPRPASPLGARQ